jgi:hypothetical protein
MENVTVSWIATDMESNVARVQVSLDHGAFYDVAISSPTVLPYLKNGQHDVTVRVTDGVGNYRDVTVRFSVLLEEKSGGISAVTVGAIAIGVIALAAVALILLKRKKPTVPSGPEKEHTKKV